MNVNKFGFLLLAVLTHKIAFGVPDDLPNRVESRAELNRMERHLRSLNNSKNIRHSFQLPSGDIIDCIDIHKQPGLSNPEVQGLPIQTPPNLPDSSLSAGKNSAQQDSVQLKEMSVPGGLDKNGSKRECPTESIPVIRLKLDDMKRFKNLDDFFRKVPNDLKNGKKISPSSLNAQDALSVSGISPPGLLGSKALHQYAHAAKYNLLNYGAHSVLNIWNPAVKAGTNEFSLSQLWVTRGAGTGLQTVEAGVQVYPRLYGNNYARLFIYSTSDGYRGNSYSSGCYNLTCGRFIQTNRSIIIGGPFSSYSVTGGTQREVEIAYLLGGTPTPNWWLYINGVPIGYYPAKLFNTNGLRNYAGTIDFGGEIVDDRSVHSYHTTTDMGSKTGAFPSAGYGKAAYQRRIWYFPTRTSSKDATSLQRGVTNRYCYDISGIGYYSTWRVYFYFGGSGYNLYCQ